MSAALWTLLGLQFRSYWRYFVRSLGTVKGALLAAVGVLFLVPYLVAMIFVQGEPRPIDPDVLRQNGPLFLLLYCVVQIVFSSNQGALYFTPAEVQFLFSGPFTRRQILVYKVVLLTLLTLPLPLVFSLMLRHHAGSWYAAMLAMALGILFLNLFTIAVNLGVDAIGATRVSRTRSLLLLALLIGFLLVASATGGLPDWGRIGAEGENLARSPILRVICWPLTWFFELFLATQIYPDLLVALALCLLVDAGMLLVVFALDRNLLELAAANSERTYALIQQMRRGQSGLAVGGGTSTWSLPDFPYLGGIGPIFWRQLMLALRGMGRLVVVLLIIGGMVTFGTMNGSRGADAAETFLGAVLSMLVMLTIFMSMLMPFDFRGDVDNIAALKTFPVAPWALVMGQLATPVLVASLFQWAILGGMGLLAVFRGTPLPFLPMLALAVFLPVFNFLMFAIENLLFLWFPIRLTQVTPGDFQSFGRNILLTLGKFFLLAVVLGVAATLGVLVYFFQPNAVLALAVAWMVVGFAGLALVPAIMVAFANFDVGRDTPP